MLWIMTPSQQATMLAVYERHMDATKRLTEHGYAIYDEIGARHACVVWAAQCGISITSNDVFRRVRRRSAARNSGSIKDTGWR